MNNEEYFNEKFQHIAVKAMLEDNELMGEIYPVLNQNCFADEGLRNLVKVIKDYYKETGRAPDYTTLSIRCERSLKGMAAAKATDAILMVKASQPKGREEIKQYMFDFFGIKELWRVLSQAQIDISKNNKGYKDVLKALLKDVEKVSKIGIPSGTETRMTDENIERALSCSDNEAIPTGIPEIDVEIAGGLGREEVGLFVAPQGYGKTTMSTLLAHNAALAGYKVLQVYFEDKPDDLVRKHYAKLTGIKCDALRGLSNTQMKGLAQKTNDNAGEKRKALRDNLVMKRMDDGDTTVEDIEEQIRRYINDGFKPDMMTIDYFSSLKHSTNPSKNEYSAQARCMRKIKNLAYKYNMAIWVMQQTNRTAVSKDGDDESMGNIQGSYEATQPCSVWLTLKRTPEQKANCRATIVFNKTRHSQPKANLENILFDNSRLDIRMDDQSGPADAAIWDDSYQSRVAQMVANNYNNQ